MIDHNLDKLAEEILSYDATDVFAVRPDTMFMVDAIPVCNMEALQAMVREWQVFRMKLEPMIVYGEKVMANWMPTDGEDNDQN